ncbi:conserved hypothetical protein [metagenome]|uniref:Sulfotransferase family protein n=1 Tax=metagenome TaxID=256318 RepID=A0A2P2CEH9_9ZZZZ
MSKRVILHVGTPKTGTSYVQDVLYRNRTTLAAHGVLYPADRFDAQFLAALDLMRLPWGGLETEAIGEWKRLAGHVRRWPGTSIISHEILATATRAQAAQALADLGHPKTEVHVVVSARDLVRQIPAEWQENVKHRRTFTYTRFLRMIRDPERASQTGSWFWGVQELPDILDRWGSVLPPERIHVVTVPKPGAPPSLLWERFAATFGIGQLKLDLDVARANPSLGSPETALLRRINVAVNAFVKPADYRPLVRELLAHQTLSKRRKSPRLGVPLEVHAWASGLAQDWNAELEKRGYDIVGDLAELRPSDEAAGFSDPDYPRERQVNKAAVEAIRALLLENVRLREAEADLHRRLGESEAALRRSYLRPTYRFRERAVSRLENGWVGKSLMKAYRRARGRSSPAA